MSWYTDIKTWIANNIRTNHQREITGAKMNTVLNDIVDEVDRKVDKVSGKGLSTNDYNNTEKAKVANAYSKPSGGIPKTDLASAVQTSLGKADTAVQTETDPTVPSWAKAQTKPTYTASEVGAIPVADKGANGGVATLDNAGKVPQSQLPSYVDDVLEYANLASFPATGESGKIYVALDTNKTYRWSGSAYVEISQSLALGETSSTAFPGDRGKAIEDKIPSNASSSNKLATKAESVPAGGTTGQVLAKKSDTDNDLEWVNQSGGGGETSNYNDLANKPSINNVTLSGNKTAAQLGLQPTLTIDASPTDDSTNPVQSGGVYDALDTKADKVPLATANDIATLGANGNLKDSGVSIGNVAMDANVVHKNGDETINGEKTFADKTIFGNEVKLIDGNEIGATFYSSEEGKIEFYGSPSEGTVQLKHITSPSASSDAATKGYVDDEVAGKQDTISDLSTIRIGAAAGATAYQKPSTGIPKTDLASGVQTSLGKADTAFQKPSGGIPASDLSTAVQTSLGKADTAIQDVSNKVDKVQAATAGNIAKFVSGGNLENSGINSDDVFELLELSVSIVDASTPPAIIEPNKVYKYGTLSGNTTFPALETPAYPDAANVYCWTFTTPATAPTITWPSGITSWAGGSAPTINASKSYEVSVMDGFATIIEN